jgi:hypothetical protein
MREQNSAIETTTEAIPQAGVADNLVQTCRWLRTSLRKFRADQLFLQERLLEGMRPWEGEGPACWRRGLGGWRLVGSGLPDEQACIDRDRMEPS